MIGPLLVVGYGKMGKQYVYLLLQKGVHPRQLIIFDQDHKKIQQAAHDVPDATIVTSVFAGLSHLPQIAFVLTNSAQHYAVLEQVLPAAIPFVFVEKPLILPDQLPQLTALVGKTQLAVGYQFSFSRAVKRFLEILRDEYLLVREVRSFWLKDRSGDERPTSGVLPDENTHPLALALRLISHTQQLTSIAVCGTLSHLPYGRYPVSDKSPSSTAQVTMQVTTVDGSLIQIFDTSSFIASLQKRVIDLSLSPANTPHRIYPARLEFDRSDKLDTLWLKGQTWQFEAHTKLSDQVDALIGWFNGEPQPLLTCFESAALLVKIAGTIAATSPPLAPVL